MLGGIVWFMEYMYYVYVIKSKSSGRYYIGSAEDIDKRIKRHNNSHVQTTKHKGPWELVYHEGCSSRTEAIKREHYIKRLKGGNGFKKLINQASSPSSSLV